MSKLQRSIQQAFGQYSHRRFVTLKKDFAYQRFSYGQIFDLALKFSTFMQEKKIRKGDRIAVCTYNSPQYAAVFVAALLKGVVLVPLDFGASTKFINQIITETDCKLLMTSRFKVLRTGVEKVYVEELFKDLEKYTKDEIDFSVREDDLVQILYTSGTTGVPKGVMLTHENILVNLEAISRVISVRADDVSLSVLPLSHVFEQVCGFLFLLLHGSAIVYMKSRRGSEIVKLFKREKISVLLTVPALLIIFKNKIEEKAKMAGSSKTLKKLLKFSDRLPIGLKRIVFAKVHKTFGGKLTRIVVGGAHLPEEVELFWERLGFKIVKGYGLTETSPILTATPENARLLGSVGPIIPEVELKLSLEKEIYARGKSVFGGYYQKKNETAAVFDDGWFKTGDIGEFDARGYLFLRGRIKNMILTASGLNVYPEDIEKHLNPLPFVREAVVVGVTKAEKTVITAVILATENFRNKFNKTEQKKQIKIQIDRINHLLELHQKIQDFVLWPYQDFPRTLTFKVKRADVIRELSSSVSGTLHDDDLIAILTSLSHVEATNIEEKMFLFADLGLDSLRVLELAALIEEKLRVEIEESKINAQTTVKVLRDFIEHAKHNQIVKKELPNRMFSRVVMPIRLALFWLGFVVIKLFITNFRVEGYEHVRQLKRQVVIIANHTSHFDILTIINQLPDHFKVRVSAGGAADYFFNSRTLGQKLLTWFMFHIFGSFPIARNDRTKHFTLKQSMEFAGEIVDKGWSLMLFPEGTRTMTGQINTFKTGSGLIVRETGLPVLPVKIEGLYEIFPKGSLLPKKQGAVTIKYGELIYFDDKLTTEEITMRLEKVIRRM